MTKIELKTQIHDKLEELGYSNRETWLTESIRKVRELVGGKIKPEESDLNALETMYIHLFIERFLPDQSGILEVIKHESPERRDIVLGLMAEKLECSVEDLKSVIMN